MQGTLSLVILMGQCCFATCHLYRFINEPRSWDEAHEYCRETHRDLASVSNEADLDRLSGLKAGTEAWIGLHRKYLWSSEEVEMRHIDKAMWKDDEPNDSGDCVWIHQESPERGPLLGDDHCSTAHQFICVDGSGREFHLIPDKMTWFQAQDYCRVKHKDLISGPQQLDLLKKENRNLSNFHWTGLHKEPWKWSDRSEPEYTHWTEEPWDHGAYRHECAAMKEDTLWNADDCNKKKTFFCSDDELVLVKKEKTWEDALYYCRDHYQDLASITNPHQQRLVQDRAKDATTSHVWLGLRYTCTLDFWFWVSDEVVRFDKWAQGQETDGCDMSGAMEKGGDHLWFKKLDEEKFNFICSKA